MSRRLPINQVFTPRSAEVNEEMYISRPLHEKRLIRIIEGAMHGIVSGESGTGKSWLCKKVSKSSDWKYYFVNFANAERFGSVAKMIANKLLPPDFVENTSYTSKKKGGIDAVFAKGELEAERVYSILGKDILETAFEYARKKAGSSRVVIFLDNLEKIFGDTALMSELGSIILLLDDEQYAKYGVKLVLVGVPSEVREYYHKTETMEPIGNRLEEIVPLRSLSFSQVKQLVTKGFRQELLVPMSDPLLDIWSNHIHTVTLGLAQRVHEYCEKLAHILEENNWRASQSLLETADREFLFSALQKAYSIIEGCMNERETVTSRRNQVLFALGTIGNSEFDAKEVEESVRRLFPTTTQGISLGIGPILSDLGKPERGLLRKISKTKSFGFRDPKYLMCLRVALYQSTDERIIKKTFLR